MKKNKKVNKFFKGRNSKPKGKGRNASNTVVKQQDPPQVLRHDCLVADANLEANGYVYLEIQEKNGVWKGVKHQKQIIATADDSAAAASEKVPEEEKNLVSPDPKDANINNDPNNPNNPTEADEESEEDSDMDEVNEDILSQGVIGLQNLGNTCYLNAAVQCISHSTPLTQYFLSNVFIHEINKKNFLGHGGRVAIAFAALLRSVWNSKPYSNHTPRNLKALMADLNPLFEGRMQHDSQEALQFLLEGIHQDLNRIKEKPGGLQVNDSDGRRDEVVAKEAWDVYNKTDRSVIVDLFMGQFRSTTKCLTCGRENHKFDSYQMVSLPIPTFDAKFIHVIVYFYNVFKKPVKYSLKLSDQTAMEHVIVEISKLTGIDKELLIPCHILRNTIYQKLALEKRITQIQLSDILIFYEAPQWSSLANPSRNVYNAPPALKVGSYLDVKDPHNNKWYLAQIVDMLPIHLCDPQTMQSARYQKNNNNNNNNSSQPMASNPNASNPSDPAKPVSDESKQASAAAADASNAPDAPDDADVAPSDANAPETDKKSDEHTENTPLLASKEPNISHAPVDSTDTNLDADNVDNDDDTEIVLASELNAANAQTQNNTSPPAKLLKIEEPEDDEDQLERKQNEPPPWGKWKIRVHYDAWDNTWDEWIDHDDARLQKAGSRVDSAPREVKYAPRYQDVPYHVMTLKMVHRRLMHQPAGNGFFRDEQPLLFGVPFLCFLPRNGFTSQELYHYVWNFLQFRYLFHTRTSAANSDVAANCLNSNAASESAEKQDNEEKQKNRMQREYFDEFNNISNAYFHIFGGSMFGTRNDGKNDEVKDAQQMDEMDEMDEKEVWWRRDGSAKPPFVLRTVTRYGQSCSRSTWDKFNIGTTVPYKSDDVGAEYLDFDEDFDFISIDWNEDFFCSFLMKRQDEIQRNKPQESQETQEMESQKEQKEQKDGTDGTDGKDAKVANGRIAVTEADREIEKKLGLRGDMTENVAKHGRKIESGRSTTFLNGMTLVFEEVLDDVSVREHFSLYNKPISIGDCIREFQKEEKLSEYYCSNCDKKIDATKSLRIWSTPPILIMHLKRVGHVGRKTNTHVDYLLNNFDVSPFLVPRTVEPGRKLEDVIQEDEKRNEEEQEKKKQMEKEKIESEAQQEEQKEEKVDDAKDVKNENINILDKLEKPKNKVPDVKKWDNTEWKRYPVASSAQTHYNLFGAIQHYGAAGGGHYTAQCLCNDVNRKQPQGGNATGAASQSAANSVDASVASINNFSTGNSKKWYLFDDHRVRAISPLDVKTKNAYMLFYVRSDLQDLFFNNMNLMTTNENSEVLESKPNGTRQRSKSSGKDYNNPSFNVKKDDIEQQFEFLPSEIQHLIGEELTDEKIKLLTSEGVESTRVRISDCIIL